MISHKKSGLRAWALALPIIALGAAPAFAAGTEVHVRLQDQSTPDADGFGIKAEPNKVPAGHVTFMVQNTSNDTIHEMLVIPVASATAVLPTLMKGMKPDKDKLDEDKMHSKGEVSELKPGEHGSVDLVLEPGFYRLLCNQRTHYRSGMTTLVTVTQ